MMRIIGLMLLMVHVLHANTPALATIEICEWVSMDAAAATDISVGNLYSVACKAPAPLVQQYDHTCVVEFEDHLPAQNIHCSDCAPYQKMGVLLKAITPQGQDQLKFDFIILQKGSLTIPPLVLLREGKPFLKTLSLSFASQSLTEEGTTAPPTAPLVTLQLKTSTRSKAILLFGGGLLLGLILAWFARKIYQRLTRKAPLPPFQQALADLTQLKERALNHPETFPDKERVTELALLVRKYLQSEWRIPALTRTNTELKEHLAHEPSLTSCEESLLQFFLDVDPYKFADSALSSEQWHIFCQTAEQIITDCHKKHRAQSSTQKQEGSSS